VSYLGRELDRHISWLEQKSEELQRVVSQLAAEAFTGEGWDTAQSGLLRAAISELGDACGRSIEAALHDVEQFRDAIRYANHS
jgi:hypothetical protein